ncbi:MAG TPA: DEAD/DEAH box helicase [Acidimicrobiales bacterium]|nr:DEAD/DEAH box helicase [Acidimicrobiales bacterium]
MTAIDPVAMRDRFTASRRFPLDPFQVEALDALDRGDSVLVAAPTGSGKTLVAEYGVDRALESGQRAFYTTPLKALSNQKYSDFVSTYGEESVGLLTGDISQNPGGRIVVMTTEVLRNMIYAAPGQLHDLGCVVLDEVHYLEDRYRGSVWEEIILSAPEHVVLICLSATVSNAEELASWIESVRGSVEAIIEEHRPVELEHLYVVRSRRGDALDVFPTFVEGRPNPEALALDVRLRKNLAPHMGRGATRPAFGRPKRTDVVERFSHDELLPAIYFIFSRQGCDEAVRFCLDEGIRLATPAERNIVREVAARHTEGLSLEDLRVLRYDRFVAGLEAGVAAHHAGLVPPFREAVEELFSQALVKVVFATETLALGINMPARSVIIESLSKFGGAGHEDLTPGAYTQLTGRAGRRGIDDVGYAAVLASPFHDFESVASLASARTSALRSSFRPTYNMAVNLVHRFDRKDAYRLVASSFAQYQSERPLSRQLDAVIDLLADRGYLAGWRLTTDGSRLAGIYHDTDLLITEAIGSGLLDGLDVPSLAGVVSVFTFEARRRQGRPRFPTPRLERRVRAIEELGAEIRSDERDHGLPKTRDLDPGFFPLAFAWASGSDLQRILETPKGRRAGPREVPISGGDFVRNVKQLVDLLRQISTVTDGDRLSQTARKASEILVRGIVAVSSSVPSTDDSDVSEDPLNSDDPPVR